jgi:hypothetical protein
MKKHALAVLGYIFATFLSQATSHFLVFKQHYAEVSFEKPEPIFALGFTSMVIQGIILSFVYANSKFATDSFFDSLKLSWLFGLFLVSYIGLAEAAKYPVPNILSWIGVEFFVGFIQFTLAGIFLKLSHKSN